MSAPKPKTTQTADHKLTRTCHDNGTTLGTVVTALEKTWAAIQQRHTDLPSVVITVASGTAGKHPVWGHFAALRWQQGTTKLPEVLIAGEGLNRPVTDVLATLLHESAHALANVRGIKDTSRQGRWHNKKFAELAGEVGLDVTKDDRIGWSLTTLTTETENVYTKPLRTLEKALTVWRHPEAATGLKRRNSNNGLTCQCACSRRIRVSATALEQGPITCGICGHDFAPDDQEASS